MSLSESEQNNIPEDLLTSPDELADQLIQSHQIAQVIEGYKGESDSVFREKAEWGIDIEPIVRMKQGEISWARRVSDGELCHLHSEIAKICSYAGDISTALEHIQRAAEYGNGDVWFDAYIDVAKARVENGEYHLVVFAPAIMFVESEATEKPGLPGKVERYGEIIQAYTKLDLDPTPHYDRTLEIIEDQGGSWRDYARLSSTMLWCNDLDRASDLIEKLEHIEQGETELDGENRQYVRNHIKWCYKRMAWNLVAEGNVKDSIVYAEKVGDSAFLADILTRGAMQYARDQRSDEAFRLTDQAIDHIEQDSSNSLLVYARTGVVHELCGRESSFYELAVGNALEQAREVEKIEGLLAIAQVQRAGGVDATATFQTALSQVEEIPLMSEDEFGDDVNPYRYRDETREEILRAMIRGGHTEWAREEAVKITSYDGTKQIEEEILLAQTGTALKPKDMVSIPQEAIAAILEGDNEKAQEAVRYFGLADLDNNNG